MYDVPPATHHRESVAAVIVAFNRKDLLTEALSAACGQTRAPDTVIVVDNASTDGTSELVRTSFPAVQLLTLPVNVGGAGGFAAGIGRAVDAGADLVWVMDDDTVPQANALSALLGVWANYPGSRPALVASKVVWTDGRDHPMNTPRRRPLVGRKERRAAAVVGALPVRSASFVSVLLDTDAVRDRGLPLADYFIWNDDFEFTTRLLRDRVGLYVPASVVVHKTKRFGATDADPGGRFYYEVRNKIWLFTRSRGLSLPERVLYAGSSARRWTRTIARSRDRATLWHSLRTGLRDGLRTGPRPTSDVLADAGVFRQP